MDRQIADAVAAPGGNALDTCQNQDGKNRTTPSHAGTPAVGPAVDTVEGPKEAGAADGQARPRVACRFEPASEAVAEVTAGTAAIATATLSAFAVSPAPLGVYDVDEDAAAGGSISPAAAAESAADNTTEETGDDAVSVDVRALKSGALREGEANALVVDTNPITSTDSIGILVSMSSSETEEAKENTAGPAAERPATARQRRNAGRVRASGGVGKSEAAGGDSEDLGASAYSVVPTAATAAAAMTRAGSSSGNVNKREQEKVKRRYEPLLREAEEALQKVIAQGLPEAETLTHPQVYLELKKTILSDESPPPGEESATVASEVDGVICREVENESNTLSFSRVKRLLRALCEGSSLPLSKLIQAVRVVLLDETDGAPQENVPLATLQSLIPVLLARRSLGVPPRRALTASAVVSSPAEPRPSPCAAETEYGTAFQLATTTPATTVAEAAHVSTTRGGASTALVEADGLSPRTRSSPFEGDDTEAAAPVVTVAVNPVGARAAGDPGLSNAFSGGTSGFDRNEDTTPSCLWMWESAFLEGLPPAFKEKAKRDREKRAVVSRRVRSLLRLQQAIEQGVEKEILVAQEKVAALEKKQQQEEERRREQQLKKRRAEEARLEKEREKKQKEDAKREKEKEKKKNEEQQKQTLQQSAGGIGGGAARSQTPAAGRTEKAGLAQKVERKKEPPSSMLNQQLLMASWLTRKPLSFYSEKTPRDSPSGGDNGGDSRGNSRTALARHSSTTEATSDSSGFNCDVKGNMSQQGADAKEGGNVAGLSEATSGRKQASSGNSVVTVLSVAEGSSFPWEKTCRKDSSSTEEEVIEVGEEAENGTRLLEKKAKEAARARAAAEAALWRVPEGKRHQFIERVLSLPKALIPLPSSSHAQIPFFDGVDDISDNTCCGAAENYLKAFVDSCAVPHSEAWREFYSFFATHRQYVCRLPPGGGMSQSQSSSNSSSGEGFTHTYCQEMREVRKGLALTDYVDVSLPDLAYLRTVVINLDEWKRPVRRLLLGKRAKIALFEEIAEDKTQQSAAWKQCTEESCIDYDRDSDEEWFETFDVDDLDDGREEEEEEDQEADEDKDWLVDDDDDVGGLKTGSALLSYGVRFESLCDWRWTFEGEDKPNYNDATPDACAVPTVRDPGWLSIYGCVVDDWGGQPFAMLEATVTPTRRKLTDEELCRLFRFCHGKTGSKIKLLAQFHRQNQHLRKSDLEKKFKEYMAYERRLEDGFKRWYVSCEAAEVLNLKEELDAALEGVRAKEALREAAQSLCQDSLEVSAAGVATPKPKQAQANFFSERTRQACNDDASPSGTLNRNHSLPDGCSLTLIRSDGVDKACVSEMNATVEAENSSSTLLTSSPAKDRNSFLPPSMATQESVHDEGTRPPCECTQHRKGTASVACNVPATGSATLDSNSASSTGSSSVTSNPSYAGSKSSVKNRASAPQPLGPPVAQDAREKVSSPVAGVTASRFRDADELKERIIGGVRDYSVPEAVDRVDLLDTGDPFASAAATAALAASSAQAAAAAAYEKRPAESASATRVALAALMAAKLAKEVALQMSGSFQSSSKFDVTVSSSIEFLGSSVCSGVAAPKSPTAQDTAFRLQSAGLQEGADRSLVSSTIEHMAREERSHTTVATPVQASPVRDAALCYQQRSPTNENAHCSILDGEDVGSNSRITAKRRRSDGSLQSYYGSTDGSICMNKRTKRPSCPNNGALPASAGSQLKNALITKFFRVVSQGPKRITNDVTDEIS